MGLCNFPRLRKYLERLKSFYPNATLGGNKGKSVEICEFWGPPGARFNNGRIDTYMWEWGF